MATFYGMLRLPNADAWKGLAGDDKWRPTRSAYELAHAWHGSGGIPAGIRDAFDRSRAPVLEGLKLELGFVEKPTFLDTPIGPSMTDIMAYARNRQGDPVIVAVEGKATEPFGLPVRAWVRGDTPVPPPTAMPRETRVRRLRFLADRLGLTTDLETPLYYQLFHRTVSGLTEAALHGASAAVLLIHSFAPDDVDNWVAYSEFIKALGAPAPEKGRVSGPISTSVGGVDLYALWYSDRPRGTEA